MIKPRDIGERYSLNAHADLFGRPTLGPAKIGIVVNEANRQLCACLNQGDGCLISEAAPGRINENGFCNRGELSPTLAGW